MLNILDLTQVLGRLGGGGGTVTDPSQLCPARPTKSPSHESRPGSISYRDMIDSEAAAVACSMQTRRQSPGRLLGVPP